MASVDTVNYLDPNLVDGTNPAKYSGSSPIAASLPPVSYPQILASRIDENLRKTFDRLIGAMDLWSQLENYYEGPEQELVYKAFTDRLERISAIKLAGEALFEAYGVYQGSIDGNVKDRHETYVSWAPGYASRAAKYEPVLGKWCRNQYGTALPMLDDLGIPDDQKMDELPKINALKEERMDHKYEADQIVWDIDVTRNALTEALNGIDMGELSAIRFETRNEATTAASSQADIETNLRNAEAFKSLNLSDEEIERIAAEVWAHREDFTEGHITDDQGRDWVMTSEGTMVRAGSVMDPRLNATVMNAIAEDPVVGQREIEYPGMTPGEKTTVAAMIWGLNKGKGKFSEWGARQFEGDATNLKGFKANMGIVGAGISILSIGATASDYKTSQSMLYPLMSTVDLDERYDRALVLETARTGGTMVVGAGLTFVAAAAGAPTGGVGGFIVAAVVDQVTGKVVGWIVDTVNESQTSATRQDINSMSDEELANQ